MEYVSPRARVSCALMSASMAAIVGSPKACTTSSWGGGAGGGGTRVSMLFCHECFKASTTTCDRNKGMGRGIWLCAGQSSSGPILGRLSFRLGVTVTVQFGHWDGGLGVCARAGYGVPRRGAHAL